MGLKYEESLDIESIEGVLAISAYDLDGSALAVDLIDSVGNKFLIADNLKGEALVRLAGNRVSVSGRVNRERYGNIIEVESFEVL